MIQVAEEAACDAVTDGFESRMTLSSLLGTYALSEMEQSYGLTRRLGEGVYACYAPRWT